MSQPLTEYFTQEAGEFLDQLEALLAGGGDPDAERFFRLSRGVRGSAQIAGVQAVARVGELLEDVARAVRDGSLSWSGELREKVRATLGDLRALVPAVDRWGAAEDELVQRAVARLEGSATHHRVEGSHASPADLLAFVGREVRSVAEEIDAVLGELRAAPEGREPLRRLLRRMRPVRGVTGHPSLAPVQEILEGVEDAAGDLLGRPGPPSEVPLALLTSARDALRTAVDLLGAGTALEGMPELEGFRLQRDRLDGEQPGETGVVPISRLFDEEAGSHIVSSPTAPVLDLAGDGLEDDVESFLRIEATGFLDQAEGLIAASEADPRRRLGRIARQLAELASGVRELAATYGRNAIAAAADDAATRLRRAGSHAEAREALRGLRAALPGGAGLPAAAAAASPSAAPASSIAPAGASSSAPAAAASTAPAAASSSAPAAASSSAPAAASSSAPAAAAAPAATTPAEDGVVPVETLLYSPADALQEAIRLRSRIEGMVGPAGRVGAPLGDLLDELFGLLTLARGAHPVS